MQTDRRRFDVTLARVAALFSLGCGTIHGAVTQSHFEEYTPFGWFFLVVTIFQIGWGLLLLIRPTSRWLVLGAVGNLAIALVWLWTRTVGVPFGPHAGEVEMAGVRDVFSTTFEVVMVAVLAVVLLRRGRPIVPARRSAVVLALAAITVAGATAVALASPDPEHAETTEVKDPVGEPADHGEEEQDADDEEGHADGDATDDGPG